MNGQTLLKQYFGYDLYRPGQEEIIAQILSGRDVLCIMPTGAGKSICYQIPALSMDGVTLVISPLVSLMKDQVTALVQNGIRAAYINSSLTPAQIPVVMRRARAGQYKIIYVAPERLLSPDFLDFAKEAPISMVTVDEAHCVSQWGHDFRTSYLQIAPFIDMLPVRPVFTAFTATATAQVRDDILSQLALRDPFIQVAGFDRQNLYFSVKKPKKKMDYLLSCLEERRDDSAIVYCSTRKNVEQVCRTLQENGFSSTRYHAGLKSAERKQNQEDFAFERRKIMVATNAFGMGIDKSNVRHVLHYNMPRNLESYYQEAGRAGRDGAPASCLLLYSPQDVQTAKFLINQREDGEEGMDRESLIARDLELLRQMTFYSTTQECLRHFILNYFGENSSLSCGSCGNCDANFDEADITSDARKILSCILDLEKRRRLLGKTLIAGILQGSTGRRILQLGLDRLPAYGLMRAYTSRQVHRLIEHLMEQEYLIQTSGEYPVLVTTEKAAGILDGANAVIVRLVRAEEPKKSRPSKSAAVSTDPALFEQLRELRYAIASRQGIPAYMVFTDAALREMCVRKPQTLEDFSAVSGVGQAKLKKYGAEFLTLLREENT